MLRQIKPKSARSKRILADREPKAIEGPKKVLFLRGVSGMRKEYLDLETPHGR